MRKTYSVITAVILVFAMTVSAFAVGTTEYANISPVETMNVSSSDYLYVGFATIKCELNSYNQSAGAFMYRDTTYVNMEYSIELHGYYVDPNTRTPVNMVRNDCRIDDNAEAFMSSASYGAGLLGVRAKFRGRYLSNPNYDETLCLPYDF